MLLSSFGGRQISDIKSLKRKKQTNPILLVIVAYLAVISVGSALLSMPFSENGTISTIDNFFVATSAICVTGLTPIDIGSSYSHIGHWIIIVLMELGGLGIMVLSTSLILLAGMKPGFGYQSVFLDEFSHEGSVAPSKIIKAVLPFTFLMETIGLGVYYWQFPEMDSYDRMFSALFQTVSTFCNVGFTLYPDSLLQFESNPLVVFTSSALVIAGGFGFLAIMDLQSIFSRKKKFSLHTKLVLIMTGILLLTTFAFYFLLEYGNALADSSFGQKVLSAFSFSAVSRTAGINLTDISHITSASLFLTLIGMFIGASPGSCGGGLKTTTFAIIAILGINRLLGREKMRILGRTVPQDTVNKAVYIFLIGVLVMAIAFVALLFTETSGAYDNAAVPFTQVLFEVTSAYATCGLSLGFTPELSVAGRIIVCIVMFIGRMGPLFLISAVASKDTDEGIWFSEENIMVG